MGEWVAALENELSKHFDTPDPFLVGVGYAVAGAAMANRVFLRSPREITTNLYLILAAPPGEYHKSSSIHAGLSVLRSVLPHRQFLSSNASDQAMAKQVLNVCDSDGVGHGVLVYDEFKSFLDHIRREYASTIGTMVMSKFERGIPVEFSRRSKDGEDGVERDIIPEGFVLSFASSTTVEWLVKGIQGSDIAGGMLSRFLLIHATRVDKTRSYPIAPPIDESRFRDLGGMLRVIVDEAVPPGQRREFKFHPRAERLYSGVYEEISKRIDDRGTSDFAAMMSRMQVYAKKLALIHAVLSRRQDTWILEDDVHAAAEMVFRSMKLGEEIVDEIAAGEGAYGKGFIRVKKILSAVGKTSKRDLLKLAHLRPRDLDEILESMERQGRVEVERSGKEETIVWKG
jgi:hypothetical protein